MNELGVSAVVSMLAATHVVGAAVNDELAALDLNLGEAHLLALIPAHGELPMRDLAVASGNRASSMGSRIDRLEAKNLVTRHRSADDRRAVSVALTDAGRQASSAVIGLFGEEADRLAALGVDLAALSRAAARIVEGDIS